MIIFSNLDSELEGLIWIADASFTAKETGALNVLCILALWFL